MKSAMKKLFSLLLVAVMLVGVMPFQAFAVEPKLDTAAGRVYVNNEEYDFDTEISQGTYSAEEILEHFYKGNVEGFSIKINQNQYGPGATDIWVPGNSYIYVYITPASEPTPNPCEHCGEEGHTTDECTHYDCCDSWGRHANDCITHCVKDNGCDNAKHYIDCPEHPDYVDPTTPATVMIRAKAPSDAGYPDGGSFTVDVDTDSVDAIFNQVPYTIDAVDYCITGTGIEGQRNRGQSIDLVAGGEYFLWIELKETPQEIPSTPLQPANPTMCDGCFLDKVDCICCDQCPGTEIEHTASCPKNPDHDNSRGKVTLTLNYNYKGAKNSSQEVNKNANLKNVISAIPAPTRDGYLFSGWTLDKDGKETIRNNDKVTNHTTIYAQWTANKPVNEGNNNHNKPNDNHWNDNNKEKFNVYVNLNYDRKMGETQKRIAEGTKMSEVLKNVDEPTRKGYKFVGWYWDENGRNDVEKNDKVLKDCTIYAKWEKKQEDHEVLLKIYLNGNTENAVKVVDMDDYDNDGKITMDEAKKVVKKYYTAKDSDGMYYSGLFDADNWNSYKRNKQHDGQNTIEVSKKDDTYVYIMVHNAEKITTSTSTADSSNPKTGDTIFMAVTAMAVSASALALVYFFNKKRAAK